MKPRPVRLPEVPLRYLFIAVALILLGDALLSLVTGFPMNSDTESSLQALRNMQRGGPFNTVATINPADVGEFRNVPLTWWTPGQYFVPYIFMKLFGLGFSHASWLVTVIAIPLGLWGLYRLYSELGFSSRVAGIGALVLAAQPMIVFFIHSFDGGRTLEYAAWPWAIRAGVRMRHHSVSGIALFAVLSFVAFFCKSSYLVSFLALLIFLGVRLLREETGAYWPGKAFLTRRENLIQMGFLALFAVLFLGTVYAGFLAHGETPSSVSRLTHNTYPDDTSLLKRIVYPLGAPVADLAWVPSKFIDSIGIGDQLPDWVLALGYAIVAIGLLTVILRSDRPPRVYKELLACFFGFYALFFIWSYVRDVPISFHGRHFRPVALLFIPGIVAFVSAPRWRWLAIVLSLFVALSFLASHYFFFQHRMNLARTHHLVDGLLHARGYSDDIEVLQELDREFSDGETLFYIVPWKRHLDLVIRKNVAYPMVPAGTGIPALRETPVFSPGARHPGIAHRLVIVTDETGTEEELLGWFPDYAGFEVIRRNEETLFWLGRSGQTD